MHNAPISTSQWPSRNVENLKCLLLKLNGLPIKYFVIEWRTRLAPKDMDAETKRKREREAEKDGKRNRERERQREMEGKRETETETKRMSSERKGGKIKREMKEEEREL